MTKKKQFPKLKYPLSAEQNTYILQHYNAGMAMQKIFNLISSADKKVRPTGVARYEGNFDTFRQRVRRTLLKGVTVRRRSKKPPKLNTVDDKLKYIAGIMSDASSTPAVKLKALEIFHEFQKEAGLDKQDNKILIGNPQNIEITPELLRELFMMCREDMGGLDTLDFDILNLEELTLLGQVVADAFDKKLALQKELKEDNANNKT